MHDTYRALSMIAKVNVVRKLREVTMEPCDDPDDVCDQLLVLKIVGVHQKI